MTTHEIKAKELFSQGYNCAQAVFAAFAEDMNIDEKTALMLSSSFGGGMGRLREVCGAVSGMFMVIGALFGYSEIEDRELIREHYERVQKLARQFKEENNSIICRDLLGISNKNEDPMPTERTTEFYKKRPCMELVNDAVRFTEKMISEEKAKSESIN